MTKVPPELGNFFAKTIEDLAAQPGEKMATNRAEAVLQENQRSVVTVRGYALVQDEPASAMGGGKGPTPTDLFISSVATCENVIFVRNAALSGLRVDSLETTAEGSWNMKGLYEIDGAEPSFVTIRVETRVRTTSPVAEVVKVARQTHVRCPIYATLRKSVDLVFSLTVNGMEVPL
jgi:putative redox protein